MESLLREVRASRENTSDVETSQSSSNEHWIPSVVESQQMLNFLSELDKLRTEDPNAYAETVSKLGLSSDMKLDGEAVSDPLNLLAESIKSSQSMNTDKSVKFQLPNSNSILGQDGIESKMKGKMIVPTEGFVIKSKLLSNENNQEKLFINLCIHDDVEKPAMKKKLNENGESVEGLNIPMSVGPGFEIIDKIKGTISKVYDIVVNTVVLSEISDDLTGKYRDFICQLCIQYIESKYNILIDKRYKLPKSKYIGDEGGPKPQYIQDRNNMPKIEVIKESQTTSTSNIKKSTVETKSIIDTVEIDLNYSLFWSNCVNIEAADQNCNLIPINIKTSDYIDPIAEPPTMEVNSILFRTEISSHSLKQGDCRVQVSPYKIQVKIKGFKVIKCSLPCVIDPTLVSNRLRRVVGFASKFTLDLQLPIDKDSVSSKADAGSRTWLVAQALSVDGDKLGNQYSEEFSNVYTQVKSSTQLTSAYDDVNKLQDDSVKVDDDIELPEDRFHKLDAASSYLINQRDQDIKNKSAKYDKERTERLNDPNVEYVDLEEYKPGGKHGPKKAPIDCVQTQSADSNEVTIDYSNNELKAASNIVEVMTPKVDEIKLSSIWTELL